MKTPIPFLLPGIPARCRIIWFLFLLITLFPCCVSRADVFISEFMASNSKGLKDEDGDFSDWIELGNTTSSAVSLKGYFLANSTNTLTQWQFPDVAVPPNGFLVVFASGKNRTTAGKNLHTSFSLNSRGEFLGLVKPDGTTIESAFSPAYPRQLMDVSCGRSTPNGGLRYYSQPTPGTANSSSGFIDLVADTKFNHDRGFYSSPFVLEITCATSGATIIYTTNGTLPALTNGLIYSGPITIPGTTVLRAAAFKAGYQPSDVDTHTYLFTSDIILQSPNGQPPSGWPTSWGSNTRDYGMDPEVVTNPLYKGTIEKDLQTLPSFSVVTDLKYLFDPQTGIYANPGQDGRDWERPASVELVYPDGRKGFQINAGIRIRGGFSRSTGNPKHALRFFFREEYGTPKLNYPVFGPAAASSFDSFDLRTFQNYSWSFQGDSRGIFLRDQFSRDTQLAMGHQAERGDYYHLYINGMYWGLYNTCERPEASYGETYYGGNKEDYDVIKVEAGPYTINATDGNMNAWTRLYNAARSGFATDEAYFKVQGRNPDGSDNSAYENLIDLPNLIDYMLVIIYGGNLDAPISNFLGNSSPNNWYGMRNRNGREGFRFFSHDAEHTLLDVAQDRTGPFSAGDSSVTKSNPQWIWQKLSAHPEFRMLVADHIQRHFFNGGTLAPESVKARLLARAAQIERAVVGESARWGDSKTTSPLTLANWRSALTNVIGSYVPRRSDIVLNQLKAKNLYPAVAAPAFSQHGGAVPPAYELRIQAASGSIYYTTDGTDPRLLGGSVSPTARTYASPIGLTESSHLKARAQLNGTWSALVEADFAIIQTFRSLLVTEIMYNPPGETGFDGEQFEFIELKNVGQQELDLSGVRVEGGVQYVFPTGFHLGSGRFAVLISDPAGFTNRYPGVRFDGIYTGRLSNKGDTISLVHATGGPIFSVRFSDNPPWPSLADGAGFSLTGADPNRNADPNNPGSWTTSARPLGSPGRDETNPLIPGILVNEILTHTDPPDLDAVELYNPTQAPVDISNWFLSDQRDRPKKFRIPLGTVIPAGGFVVFNESQFNANPALDTAFTLSSHGEEIYLFSADKLGELTGYSDGFAFPAAENGVTFGRLTNSVGQVLYPPQLARSLGSPNAGPRVGAVVISEINYHPKPGDEEFLELKNRTSEVVRFYDPLHPTNTWRIDGVGFTFPAGFELKPGGLVLVVPSNPESFRRRYAVPAEVPVLGPYPGNLQDSGERIELLRPDQPDVLADGSIYIPYVLVDSLRYSNQLPWPPLDAAGGVSLERIKADAFGDDPANWRASAFGSSPGLDSAGNRPPRLNPLPDISLSSLTFPVVTNLLAIASDDGQPNPPGRLNYTWTTVSGPAPVVFSSPDKPQTAATFLGVGSFRIRVTVDDGALVGAGEFTVTVGRTSGEAILLPAGSSWKYLDTGTDQGVAWRQPAFDDSSWKSGKAQLGFGDGDEVTTLGFGPDPGNKYPTTYFRTKFNISEISSVRDLRLRLLRDDGAVIYLNGTEVFRNNMPEGTIDFATRASATISGDEESTVFIDGILDKGSLVNGQNTLAVEIHQVNATSTDLSFDMELLASVEPPNQKPISLAGQDLSVASNNQLLLHGYAADDGLPLIPGKLTNIWTRISGPGGVSIKSPTSLDTVVVFDTPGVQLLRLTVGDGQLTSTDEVQIQVTGSGFPAWQKLFFSSSELTNPLISGEAADPDRDGMSNLAEYLSGTNPKDPASRLALSVTTTQQGFLKLRFDAAAGISYTLQSRDNLNGAAWVKVQDFQAPAAAGVVEVNQPSPAAGTQRYYRLTTPISP